MTINLPFISTNSSQVGRLASVATGEWGGSTIFHSTLSASSKKRIARHIRSHRAFLASGWAERHAAHPIHAARVLEEVADWDSYRRSYAEPLLFTLARAIESGQTEFLHIYRAERLRFLSPDARKKGGDAELRLMLADDVRALEVQTLPLLSDEAEIAAWRHILAGIHAHPTDNPVRRTLKVAFVGDCVMTEVQAFLYPMTEQAGLAIEGHHFYFSARLQAELATAELEAAIDRGGFDLIALSFLTFEGLPIYTSLLREAASSKPNEEILSAKCDAILSLVDRYVSAIRAKTNIPVLLHGCSGLPLSHSRRMISIMPPMAPGHALVARMLDDGLKSIADGMENVIFMDEAALVGNVGIRRASRRLLPRLVTHSALFHPSRLGLILAQDYARIAAAYDMLGNVKVLLVDFDNTLWSGVMADGEVLHDHAAQKLLKELKEAGILLVSVSKNDPRNIRWDEMLLDEDDFVLHKISWDTKPQSVLEVAGQLDLDPKSFVLIDDNPVERSLVETMVAGVRTIDPTDPASWRDLALLLRFPATRQTEEAGRRTAMYREAAERREATSATVDYGTMMRSLDLRVRWRRAVPADVDRVHELVSRTNQFNTTTIRYGAAELSARIAEPDNGIFVASLSDKFGDLGVVGTVITSVAGNALHFDNVVMSCRAMGFGLETLLIQETLASYSGLDRAIGRYISTERNNPCADLFAQNHFIQVDAEHWERDLMKQQQAVPDWFTIERS